MPKTIPRKKSKPRRWAEAARVLRCRETEHYFTGEGWSRRPQMAQRFPNDEEAMRACLSFDMRDVDLVLWAADGTEIFATQLR